MTAARPALPLSETPTALSRPLADRLAALPPAAHVLDVGCLGWKLYKARPDLVHHGCDMAHTTSTPPGVDYRECDVDRQPLPWPDDHFDLVVASHLIEHLDDPIRLAGELVRVCRPGGHVYIEAPSARSLRGPALDRAPHAFFSHWDDPTHRRPWTPRAFYRLLLGYDCRPVAWGHDTSFGAKLAFPFVFALCWATRDWDRATDVWWRAVGFAAYVVGRKPLGVRGAPAFTYRSLKGIAPADVGDYFDSLERTGS